MGATDALVKDKQYRDLTFEQKRLLASWDIASETEKKAAIIMLRPRSEYERQEKEKNRPVKAEAINIRGKTIRPDNDGARIDIETTVKENSRLCGQGVAAPLLELSVKLSNQVREPMPVVVSASEAVEVAKNILQDKDREYFIALHLNAKNKVVATEIISIGSQSAALVHPREAFKGVFLYSSAAVIFAHNHPSGDPTPSREDMEITSRLYQLSEIFGVRLLDHIIIGGDSHFSISDAGGLSGTLPDWSKPDWERPARWCKDRQRRKEIKQEVRRIRRKLEITPRHANALFCHNGEDNFYSFESGHVEPAPATLKLLTLLDKHPELLQEIVSEP